ncbi:PREDICTED: uncharacterized protein LOC108615529 [Drosophila arizonae]|uniref:Regulatory protein zeste n=1 Tax=Drosophila arizonae TaxID=7263 RepID=A0ABM1PED1_DROAR|nr:PREDICTED: uncharacterized protein LOC108615529 [Drosophila arizonae]
MTSRRQRTRMPNFTVAEENVLRALTAKYFKQIEEKTSNAHVWRAKNRAWEDIAIEFFKNTNIQRSAVKLKSKYETMKKLNKLANMSVKTEPTLVEDSLRLVDQNGEVGESQMGSVQVEVEQAKLLARVKTEIQSEEEADMVDQDQTMSVHHHAENSFGDGDQIMSEPKFDVNCKIEPTVQPSTEKGVKLVQQYTNINQGGDEQIIVAKNTIPSRQTGIESLRPSHGEKLDLTTILTKKLFETSFKPSKELSGIQKSLAAQFRYYRNSDIRAQQKHLAELKNLEVQRKILELELKIKQKEFDKN